jgi:alkylhydroperoxidase family enzyme
LVDRINAGTDLSTLIAAGSLANARTFGGHDYIGFHTFMALTPALEMSFELPTERKALPILKVLYRNTDRIQQFGGSSSEVLKRIDASKHDGVRHAGEALQATTRKADFKGAERIMASLAGESPEKVFNYVQYPVQDTTNVHRVVLAWRAWLAIDLVGEQHANTLLRQSVQFCLKASESRIRDGRPDPELWTLIPKLLDQYKLLSGPVGDRSGDDEWIEELAWTFFQGNRGQAADAAAQALADGFAPDQVGEALSIAANLLLLHDPGRKKDGDGDKVKGTVHGASVGVHASDAANAWRNISRVSNHRNAVASLLVGAYHTAGQSPHVQRQRWPLKMDAVESVDDKRTLLAQTDEAVRNRDQALAGAAVQRYSEVGGSSRAMFDLLLKYATSEDGALHAEKYYRTVTEEFAKTRPSMRWRQLVGLARVSASEYGTPAPGYREACKLLRVDV